MHLKYILICFLFLGLINGSLIISSDNSTIQIDTFLYYKSKLSTIITSFILPVSTDETKFQNCDPLKELIPGVRMQLSYKGGKNLLNYYKNSKKNR